ncbi:VOC family protein [Paenibacillus radicis (ex Gao et al. 2016)]|uniref:Extradiol dioxygenase n=1 Tax=Paenibacillus radicis (ex Gao et al. 2016) TaxID=1737354 RepID=A0A917HE77_9BACL|nr:VOC family protein [Paenibacillus radicis (ex Gao et al. 2016)]GGG75595.1 extradiol dioxygenase [Paenibacillus radicis (ex Gao et al. 2016)]
MKIAHIRLFVPNVKECFLFYRDLMGLEVLHGNEDTPYAEFQTGDIHLALEPLLVSEPSEIVSRTQPFSANERLAIIVSVDDVDVAFEQLRSNDITFIKEPHDTPEWGHRVAYLRDPAGNLIEINGGI